MIKDIKARYWGLPVELSKEVTTEISKVQTVAEKELERLEMKLTTPNWSMKDLRKYRELKWR